MSGKRTSNWINFQDFVPVFRLEASSENSSNANPQRRMSHSLSVLQYLYEDTKVAVCRCSHSDHHTRRPVRTYDSPETDDEPRRQRQREDVRNESPSIRAAARRSTGGANIQGSFEYVDSNEVTYGGNVLADRENGIPWKGKVRSFSQDIESPEVAEDSSYSSRRSVQFVSPVATVFRSPSNPVPPQDSAIEFDYDVDPLASSGWGR